MFLHNPLSQKIDFSGYLDLVVTLGALSVGIWWLFDRSQGGLLLELAVIVVATVVTYSLLHFHILR